MISMGNHTVSSPTWNKRFAWVFFSKCWNSTSRFGKCNFRFLINSQVQINYKLYEKNRMNTYNNKKNMEKFAWRKCRNCLKPFFPFEKAFFKVSAPYFRHLFTWYYWLRKVHIVFQHGLLLSANHNPEWRCVICTGVAFFVLVLHLNCTALS